MISKVACLFDSNRNPYHNMGIEAYLWQKALQDTAVLFLWHTLPCVELGCGLDVEQSCNIGFLDSSSFFLTRRTSGGVPFYMDEGTIGYSLLVPRNSWNPEKQTEIIRRAMYRLGLPMQCCFPYTVSIGKKMPPTIQQSYYLWGNMGMEHGCIHVDTSHEMEEALLKTPLPFLNVNELNANLKTNEIACALCEATGEVYRVNPCWLDERSFNESQINQLADFFSEKKWVELSPVRDREALSKSFNWGNLTVGIEATGGRISYCSIRSDAMEAALLLDLEKLVIGTPCLIGAVNSRIEQKVSQIHSLALKRMLRECCALLCERISNL